MDKMQQDAINRMKDMEKRAKNTQGYYNPNSVTSNTPSQEASNYNNLNHYNYNYNHNQNQVKNNKHIKTEEKKSSYKEHKEKHENEKHINNENIEKIESIENNKKDNLLEELFKDKEKTLILALIALLCTEKTDYVLVLALIYLII